MTITQASHEAYELYTQLEPNGREQAAAKALTGLKPLLKKVTIDQLIDEEKEAERLADIADSYDRAWY